jgi:carbonic anhydrase
MDALIELDKIAAFEKDWDRKNSNPIHPKIIGICKNIVNQLPVNIETDIVPNSDGTITLKWNNDKKGIIVDIGLHKCKVKTNDGIISFGYNLSYNQANFSRLIFDILSHC